ncbi:MAG TPA: hypothetical protein DCM08_14585 [Microscillaceae bacterium]|jgi:hypothetical protein|nr:hypothetical protein [Microscillaceae bacterium]
MELKEIASISGKQGLFKILKPTRAGVIVESLDDKRTKFVAGANSRVSVLKDVSIYTTDGEGSAPLGEVLVKIKAKFQDKLPISSQSSAAEMNNFLAEVLPQYDPEKVYPSDIKKLANWYSVLLKYAPEVFEEPKEESKPVEKENTEEPKATSKTKKVKEEVVAEEEKPAKKAPKAKAEQPPEKPAKETKKIEKPAKETAPKAKKETKAKEEKQDEKPKKKK